MQDKPVKICPLCKTINDAVMNYCINCGVPLGVIVAGESTVNTIQNSPQLKAGEVDPKNVILEHVPETGMGIYINRFDRPDAIVQREEFFLGRKTEGLTNAALIDLDPFGALDQGVSRRHVRIYRVGSSYRCMDLQSTNGAWIDNLHLVPKVSYTLNNRTQLRLGRFNLFLAYKKPTGVPPED
jgi:hypothetical protein